ncbi:holin family protein [Bacillus sp. B1-b2]|uniref:phage holin family protein n=1 Tax=Bacillus sp. B1-b2 TaxID=2653201 RepID=UPI001261E2ED|nr:phage holin family protein [Bacillus sp. B1-b2]KAB7662868.1 phage holin family protein [Bacillus sp. B1-b2]
MSYLQELKAWLIAGVGTSYAFITGHFDQTLQILLAIMAVDLVSGIMRGLQKKELKSSIMSLGIIKKGAILLSILFAYLLDLLLNDAPVFVTLMTWLAIGNEGLSIVENLTAMGVKIPRVISDSLLQIKKHVTNNQTEKESKKKDI